MKNAINEFFTANSANFDATNLDINELQDAITEEFDTGFSGDVADSIRDLHDTIGLDTFGVVEK